MSRLNSFYLPASDWPESAGDTVLLKGAEARHMLIVLRTRHEQIVRLFDGWGRDGLFEVTDAGKNKAVLRATKISFHEKPDRGLTLAIAWGKSKRRNYLFEKIVELNGDGVVFWQADRSQGNTPVQIKETWKDKCIQAAKQCGNVFLPDLTTLTGGVDALADYAANFENRYVAWESGDGIESLTPMMLARRSFVVIGPEGGFEPHEIDQLEAAGLLPVNLGHSILRWETAASYCLSLSYFAGQIA